MQGILSLLRRLMGDRRARRESEAELRDQVALSRALIEENPNAMYLKDTQGRYVIVNDAWLKMVGVTRGEAIGRNVLELFPEKESERYHAEDMRLLQQGAGLSEVESLRTGPDGKPQWVIIRKAVLRRADGTVVGLIGANTDITERKRYEAELAAERQRLALVVSATQAGMIDWDMSTESPWYSERFKEMLGYPADADTSAWSSIFGSLMHPDDRDRSREVFFTGLVRQGAPNGITVQDPLELRLRRADGSWLWVESHGLTLHDEAGEARRYLGAITDISGRHTMEDRLREQIALTQAIVAQAPNSIFAKDREGRFTLANRGWSQMSGVPAEQALGRTVHDLYPPEAAQRFAAEDARLLAQGASATPVEQLHTGPRPGQYRIVRKAVLSRDGEVLGLVCSSTDVTELKRMESELALERDRLQLLVRSTKAGFLDWDPITDTRIYSARFKEMLGYPADTDTSQWPSLLDMVHPQDREPTREAFRNMLRSGAATGERMHGPLECRLRKADGSYLWVRGEGIAQINAEGRTERFLASYIDITQLRELNLALEESVRLREEVDRIGRHDLKTPLNSIIGIPRLLRDSGRLSAEDGELLAFVEQAGYRLLNMVNLSLDMFRMERGNYPFTPKAIDLRDVLGKVVRDIEHHARAKRVALRIEGPPLYALAEELLCYSMFGNLAKNALEASPEGGTVGLSLAESGDSVLVRVHNAGAVPEAVRARFFDKYSTAGKSGGSGLGTYSARLMALTQKGDIEMQTGDAGTTLSVRLMRASPEEVAALTAKSEKHTEQDLPTELQPLSVLVVDDDEYTRVFVQRFLPRSMRTRSAANGREAVDAARQDPPDVIIMDLDMPVMGGLEAAVLIRRREAEAGGARCAMIAMSSHDDPAMPARSLEAGFDRFVAKPVSPEALRRAIAELSRAKDMVLVDADLADALPGFLASRREMVAELSQAVAAGGAEPARALAHKLAGSLALYGFQWAAEQSRMIEKRAREGRLEGLAGEIAALGRYLEGVRTGVAAKGEAEARL